MKSNHKKSNRMLLIGSIFLVVYLLASIIFGSVMLDKNMVRTNRNRSVSYSVLTVVPGVTFTK
ncbi:MAG: hypothetical protein WCS35_04265 [Sphaerochaeta sp.]|jgi:hypothetical protein|nr:hypothetical protein [Spirochaetales bacterium]